MRKFLRKILIFALTLAVITEALNLYYIHRTSLHDDSAKMQNVPYGIQICNFGSSHGLNDFDYEDVEGKYVCFNFGLGSQGLLYDNKILRHYRGNIMDGATVFIVISHFSFFGIPDIKGNDFLSKNRRYYTFLPAELIECYDKRTDFYVNYMPALVSDNLMTFLMTMFIPPDIWEYKSTNREESLKHGNARYERFIETKKDINGKRIYNHEAVNALYDMIDICRQIGATPILITTPYLKEYNDAVRQNDPEFYEDFYSIISEVVSKTGVKYYDYSSDERYTNDYSLFFNTDHLNRKGARIFTDNILHEILGIDRKTRHKPLEGVVKRVKIYKT